MTLDASNVRVAVSGWVATADPGTAIPTSADDGIPAGFEDLGYVSEDGVVQSINSSTSDIKAWQDGAVVRKVQTSHDLTYSFTLIETKPAVLENYYGNYLSGTVKVTADQLPRKPWVIDVLDGDTVITIAIPDGQVTERGDITYATGDAIGYEVTVTCYPDSTGTKAYLYIDNGS